MAPAISLQRPAPLPFLGVLRLSGPDAASFLQGQVTHDTGLLADGRTLLAACSTPQGRVVALLRLRQHGDSVLALLPTELVEPLAARLGRFVLRAKVRLEPATDLVATAPAEASGRSAGDVAAAGPDGIWFDYAPGRRVLVAPRAAAASLPAPWPGDAAREIEDAWWLADIAAGLPQVFAASSEAFVPQMLNLDRLDAISFTKGCYTGQEIVARTQHLGRIKRRTARLRLPAGPTLPPLAGLTLDGAKVAEVVMSAPCGGGVELLAVTSLEAWGRPLAAADGREAVPLELPYAVTATA
jgi:folate-binding protein YgfZ